MKKGSFILLLIVVFPSIIFAQILDTNAIKKIVDRGNKSIVIAIEGQTRKIQDAILPKVTQVKVIGFQSNSTIADFITFLPVLLFLLILIVVLFKLKKDNVKLSDFLIDKDIKVALKKEETTIATANANATIAAANAIKSNVAAFIAANVAPQEIPLPATPANNLGSDKQEQSTSRLLAFVSGLTTVGLATCITSFYFYRSFLGDANTNLGNLSTVIYGLGLGVIPYGFNKIANALK